LASSPPTERDGPAFGSTLARTGGSALGAPDTARNEPGALSLIGAMAAIWVGASSAEMFAAVADDTAAPANPATPANFGTGGNAAAWIGPSGSDPSASPARSPAAEARSPAAEARSPAAEARSPAAEARSPESSARSSARSSVSSARSWAGWPPPRSARLCSACSGSAVAPSSGDSTSTSKS
jgi:hypothetical protein